MAETAPFLSRRAFSSWEGARFHQRRLEGYLFASNASTPNVLPALLITSARATAIGTSSSQIHAVPHSETHKVVRKRKAAKATGRVNNPSSKRIPNEISVAPCIDPTTFACATMNDMTDFST